MGEVREFTIDNWKISKFKYDETFGTGIRNATEVRIYANACEKVERVI